MKCTTCERYDLMGFAYACPCVHVNGKCTTPTTKPPPARSELLRDDGLEKTTTMDNNTIYAIYDNVAKATVGMLTMHKHEASAVRMYADIASLPDTQIGKHPQDFDLVRLGHLRDHKVLDPDYHVVLKGSIWAASRTDEPQLSIAK